jgi:hypothetical protein
MTHFKRSLVIILSLLFFLQCSEEESNNDIEVNLNPKSPIVFLSPLGITIGDTEKTIQPPSFNFYLQLINKTKENLFIVAVSFTLTGTKQGKIFEGKTFSLSPSDILDANGDPRTLTIADLAAGDTFDTENPIFVESIPNAEKGDADSFVYTINGIVEAYTGESISKPNRNVRKRFSFVTSPPN